MMKKRIVYDDQEKIDVINKCDFCRVGLADETGAPYVFAMSFGFDGKDLYLHTGRTGKKHDILAKNNRVCVEFSTDYQMYYRNEEVACSYGVKYRSVLMHGSIEFIDDPVQKREALDLIMLKYTGKRFPYNDPAVENVCIMRIHPVLIEGKVLGY